MNAVEESRSPRRVPIFETFFGWGSATRGVTSSVNGTTTALRCSTTRNGRFLYEPLTVVSVTFRSDVPHTPIPVRLVALHRACDR
jgi:hypothetical protein